MQSSEPPARSGESSLAPPLSPNLQYAWQLALSGLDGHIYMVTAPLRAPALHTAQLSITIVSCAVAKSEGAKQVDMILDI